MYKFLEKRVVNGKNRRIFIKNKKEYIKFQNDFITLNSFNKKQKGGGFLSSLFGKKNSPEPTTSTTNIDEKQRIVDILTTKKNELDEREKELKIREDKLIENERIITEKINEYNKNIELQQKEDQSIIQESQPQPQPQAQPQPQPQPPLIGGKKPKKSKKTSQRK